MWWGHGFEGLGWGSMLFGGLMMLLFWGGLIALLVVAARAFLSSQRASDSAGSRVSTGNTALDILKERFARGEITRADYETMREDLKR
jgi:putative membrane protein